MIKLARVCLTIDKQLNMTSLEIQRIPFHIRFTNAAFKGEIFGSTLGSNAEFEVRLSDGRSFRIQASKQLFKYTWTTLSKTRYRMLIPVIGKLVEKHFARLFA